jgi:hypothetical protein
VSCGYARASTALSHCFVGPTQLTCPDCSGIPTSSLPLALGIQLLGILASARRQRASAAADVARQAVQR